MKDKIHPKLNDVIFRDIEAKKDFYSKSTLSSETTEEKNGITYFVVPVDVSSASHPFYTGDERIIDTAGRVEKFKARVEKSKKGK